MWYLSQSIEETALQVARLPILYRLLIPFEETASRIQWASIQKPASFIILKQMLENKIENFSGPINHSGTMETYAKSTLPVSIFLFKDNINKTRTVFHIYGLKETKSNFKKSMTKFISTLMRR